MVVQVIGTTPVSMVEKVTGIRVRKVLRAVKVTKDGKRVVGDYLGMLL